MKSNVYLTCFGITLLICIGSVGMIFYGLVSFLRGTQILLGPVIASLGLAITGLSMVVLHVMAKYKMTPNGTGTK